MSKASRLMLSIAFVSMPLLAADQIPEQNINMVAGTNWPHGDPYLQRQNEPSVAVSTRNFLNVLALTNDYRSVDIPFDSPVGVDSEERGDAWIGVFKSRNGGQTWWSDLLDGFPQQANSTSPLHGFQAAADPVVRSGPNGMFYASGIVLNRTLNPLGGVFVTRFIDNNNTENGDPFVSLGAKMIDTGTSGAFIDKPWLAVGPGTGNCTVSGETFPAQNVYVAYTVFVGGDNNIRTKLMFARSTDCGATWSAPQKLSEGYPVNQGATIVVSPTGPIYVVWRQFKTNTAVDALLIAKSTDNGQTFTKAATIRAITPFEQGTVALPSEPAIRTNAYPAAAADSSGRLYVVWSDRGFQANGDGRVVMVHSLDGVSWSGPIVVDAATRGHQFMPAIAVTAGKIVVAYYDLRDDSTMGVFTKLGGGTYSEARQAVGDRPIHPELVFSQYLQEYLNEQRRHTLDLRGASLTASAMGPVINGYARLSRYVFGSRQGSTLIEQMQYNPPDLPMFRLGTAPFIGDYIDITGYTPKTSSVYHAVWTDNRDVRPPLDGNWANYTPVFSPSNNGTSKFNGQAVPPCVGGQTGMRNQNIYTTRITEGLFVGAPGNAKQLGTIQRAFTVFAQNAKGQAKTFRMTATPSSGTASFDQLLPNVPSVDVPVPAHSTATRTVYVTSADHHASVTVDVVEIDGLGGNVVPGGLTSSALINPDVSNPDVSNPDPSTPDVSNPDVSNPDVSNPDVSNAEVHNPDVSNPDVSNPDVSNPDVSNPDVSNPDVSNPDVSNPDVSNPDVSNPDVSNPDVSNPDVSNSALGDATDYTWKTHNKGNTTSGYNVKLAANAPVPDGVATQLIIYRIYQTPIATGCNLTQQKHSQILSNTINPKFVTLGDITAVDPNDASLYLAPGDAARITLRVYAPPTTFNPVTAVAPAIVSQARNNINGVIAPTPSIALPPTQILFITTRTTNDAIVNHPYSTSFAAIGGTPPYTWTANVPSFATFTGNVFNLANGFPTTGTTTISVSATDAANTTATVRLPVNVYDLLQITTSAIPDGTLNQPYSTTLQATGGKPPYVWSKYKPASFPPWLNLNPATGQLSGTPTLPGIYDVNILVDDSANPSQEAFQQFHINVPNPLSVSFNPGPTTTTAGQTMTVGVLVRDNTGAVLPGVNVTLTLGNNPGGDSLNLNALTNAVGVATFQVTLNNPGAGYTLVATATAVGLGTNSTTSGSFDILPAPLAITTASVPDMYEGDPTLGFQFSSSGGTRPISWSITRGVLPRALDLTSAGTIAGVPTVVTFTTFDVTATDSGSPQQSATKTFTIQTWAPRSAQCVNGTFPLYNNWDTAGGNITGGGQFPTAVAGGRPNGYTIASMEMYHIDVPTLESVQIAMIGISSADLGPWSVTVQRAQGFATLTVNVPQGTVLNDASGYTVEDSDQSSWAQNDPNNHFGFTAICVTPNP